MNAELKAMIQMIFDVVKTVEDAVEKKDFVIDLLPKLYKLASDIPSVVTNWADLMPEISKLKDSDAEADLVAFVISQIGLVNSDEHAKKIVAAVLELALALGQKGIALEQAIKGQ